MQGRMLHQLKYDEVKEEYQKVTTARSKLEGTQSLNGNKEYKALQVREAALQRELHQLKAIHDLIAADGEPHFTRCYRVEEIYQQYGFKNPKAMYRAINSGYFPAVPLGKRRWLIHPGTAAIWLKDRSRLTMMLVRAKYAENQSGGNTI